MSNAPAPALSGQQAEDLLGESERWFRQVAESLPQLIWTCTAEGPCDYLSPQWLRYTGRNEAEQLGYGWLEQIHPHDRERVIDEWSATAKACRNFNMEFRIRRGDGVYRWFRTLAVPLRDEAGRVVKWLGSNTDIDDLKQTEKALRESEERLRLATEHAEIGHWDVDVINDILIWPPMVKAMFGISPDVPVSMQDFYNGLHPEDRAATSDAYAAAADPMRRALYDVEYRTVGKEDGQTRWVAAKGRGVFSAEGRCIRVIGTAIDITKRKETEKRLAESEARFRAMAETVPDIFYVTDEAGSNEYANPNYVQYTGLSQKTLSGFGWVATIHPEDRVRILDKWRRALASREPFEGEVRLRRHDGVYRWFVTRANPMRDQTGGTVKWFGAATDIEPQKQIEKALTIANEDLNQFAYAASHDLREPLRNISLYAELLVRSCGDGNDEIARMKTVITEGVARIENLLADLLSYALVSAAGEDFGATTSAISAVEKALKNLETTIASSQAEIFWGDLPVVAAAEPHLVQLFQNLIGNAIQYRGPQPPKITISASRKNGEWLFSVKDNGIGIDPQYHHKIFGLFKRLHGRNIPGTGIGLAICQKVVARYGGRIWVDSEPGKGAEFLFTIPVHRYPVSLSQAGSGQGSVEH
jgi:PAS domain S-box-containing protein